MAITRLDSPMPCSERPAVKKAFRDLLHLPRGTRRPSRGLDHNSEWSSGGMSSGVVGAAAANSSLPQPTSAPQSATSTSIQPAEIRCGRAALHGDAWAGAGQRAWHAGALDRGEAGEMHALSEQQ